MFRKLLDNIWHCVGNLIDQNQCKGLFEEENPWINFRANFIKRLMKHTSTKDSLQPHVTKEN